MEWDGSRGYAVGPPPSRPVPGSYPTDLGQQAEEGRCRWVQVGSGMGSFAPPAGDTFPVACSFPMVPSSFLSCPRSHEWGLHADLPTFGCKRREKWRLNGLPSTSVTCSARDTMTPLLPCAGPATPHPWSSGPMMLLGVTLEQTPDSLHDWFFEAVAVGEGSAP